MKNVTIKIEAEALLKLIELGYGFEVIGNTHIPGAINIPKLIDAPQFIQPYFRQPPVMNLPNYNNVNLGNIVVNYLLEMKQNQQHDKNADAFHSNRTSGIYHNVLNYQYFDNTVNARWQFKIDQNDIVELHNPGTIDDYLSVQHGALFYHYLNRLTGKSVKIPIAEASGYISPNVTLLLDSAIQWGADNPSAVLRFNINDVTALIQSQSNMECANVPTQSQTTDNEVITPNEIVRTETVFVEAVPAETKPVEPVPNNVNTGNVEPLDPEKYIDIRTVRNSGVQTEAATAESITVDGKTLKTILDVISIVEGYVNSRKEKKRNSKFYTSQLSALSGGFDLAMVKLNRVTDLSAIREFEHKLNILKDELNCLTIGITANAENPLYYVNSLLKYYN